MKKRDAERPFEYGPFEWSTLTPAPIIGVDEVGRGCLAGPVYAAAVILNSNTDIEFYTDSKLISEKRREELCVSIQTHHRLSIGFATVEEIERLNIFKASLLAMKRAVLRLNTDFGHILVDGKFTIPDMPQSFHQTALVKGDLRAAPVAAASIVAKVARDRFMAKLAEKYQGYGFEQNKGYATDFHREALKRQGPCAEHRRSFGGVREFFEGKAPVQGTLL